LKNHLFNRRHVIVPLQPRLNFREYSLGQFARGLDAGTLFKALQFLTQQGEPSPSHPFGRRHRDKCANRSAELRVVFFEPSAFHHLQVSGEESLDSQGVTNGCRQRDKFLRKGDRCSGAGTTIHVAQLGGDGMVPKHSKKPCSLDERRCRSSALKFREPERISDDRMANHRDTPCPGRGSPSSRAAFCRRSSVDSRTRVGSVYARAMAASEIPSVATVSRRLLNGLGMLVPLGVFDTLFPLNIEYIASVDRATRPCRAVSRRVKDEASLPPEDKSSLLMARRWCPAHTACSMHVHAILTVMTRKQVALRLGKSLATVRRIEGSLLYPTRDARGVHHFDDSEVETLARSVKSGSVRLSQELGPATGDAYDFDAHATCENCAGLKGRVAALLAELEEQRHRHDLEVRELRRERSVHEAESRELVNQFAEFIELFEHS
jgi:hypothetical protein